MLFLQSMQDWEQQLMDLPLISMRTLLRVPDMLIPCRISL